MKCLLITFALTLPLLAPGGAFADDAKLLVLDDTQLEQVNAGRAFASARADAFASGSRFSFARTRTTTLTWSIPGSLRADLSYISFSQSSSKSSSW